MNNRVYYINKYILNIFIFLFIFNMFNREFIIGNLDLRYFLVPISILLIILKIYRLVIKKDKLHISKLEKLTLSFIFITIASNLAWTYNELNIGPDFVQYNILFIFNALTIGIVILYKQYIKKTFLKNSIIISGIILFLSMIMVILGINISNEYTGIFVGGEYINFFNSNFRVAGYAQDPNYATMFMVILAATAICLENRKYIKYITLIISIIGFMLSASKTILLGVFISSIVIFLKSRVSKIVLNRIYFTFISILAIGPYISIKAIEILNLNTGLSTLDLRFEMWKNAANLFEKSPLIGNGLTSFRSFLSSGPMEWYVHSHSTIFQMMSETGIIALVIFAIMFYNILKNGNNYIVFITIVFLIFSITYELNYLSLFAFMVTFLPLILSDKNKYDLDSNRVLYLINSLGSGGAERVVANSANQMAINGKQVTIITIKNIVNYKFNENVKIISLNEPEGISKYSKLLRIPYNIYKINNIISELERDRKFCLITSHLPIMHVVSRFLEVKDRILFVIHNPHYHMDPNNSLIFKLLLRYQYNNKKIVTVSKGVETELVRKYGVKTDYIKTIYNPIDILGIQKSSRESVENDRRYILFCGRLTIAKRVDRLINVFYKGKFYEEYDLVLIGDGELKEELEIQCKDLNISKYVKFKGWQSNVYKWMKNCEVMVSTSDYESFGMTLVEGLACSAKVVSVDCDFGPNEILTGKFSEYLCPVNEIEKIILTLRKALETYPKDRVNQVKKFDCNFINEDYINTSLKWIKTNFEENIYE